MLFAIIGFALLVPAAFFVVWNGPVARRRNARLRPDVERRLDLLIWAANEWKGTCHDFAPSGIGDGARRLLHLTPSPDEHWFISRHPKKGACISLPVAKDDGPSGKGIAMYPAYGWSSWSREPWLKAKLDHLEEIIARLPPPRTHEEWMRMSQERHEAFMAECAAFDARMEKELAEIRAAYPSLDDPLDDMD